MAARAGPARNWAAASVTAGGTGPRCVSGTKQQGNLTEGVARMDFAIELLLAILTSVLVLIVVVEVAVLIGGLWNRYR